MQSPTSPLRLFFAIGTLLLGLYFLHLGYNENQNISSFTSENNAVTVIQINENKNSINLKIISSIILLSIGLVTIISLRQKKSSEKPIIPPAFTAQEKSVIDLIKAGKANKEIASELSISLSTVKSHVNSIYKKAGVHSRGDLLNTVK